MNKCTSAQPFLDSGRDMALKESLCFAQFMHPGREAEPLRGAAEIGWNNGRAHARKYLRCSGTYLHDGAMVSGLMDFWGEWEPESDFIKEWGWQPGHKPQRVWEPYYEPKDSYAGLQNTDPFVFGGFYYSICKQYTRRGPTQLRYLSKGSVLLFGSCVGSQFVLDTVFVVKGWIDHDETNYRSKLTGKVPDAYFPTTLYPLYGAVKDSCVSSAASCMQPELGCAPESSSFWRLYFGATCDDPVDGMFSFIPCQPDEKSERGFARPAIELPGIVNPKNRQQYILNPQTRLDDVVELWHQVKAQVQEGGLSLGVSVDVPPQR